MTTDVGRVGKADQALVSDGAAQGVSTLSGFDPSRGEVWTRAFCAYVASFNARTETAIRAADECLAAFDGRFPGKERQLYEELLFAVERKHEGETRHETALRYIIEREAAGGGESVLAFWKPAIATEARRAGTGDTDPVHEGAGRDSGIAQTLSADTQGNNTNVI